MDKEVIENTEIDDIIDNISEKFGYDDELKENLKRIVPSMLKGKNDESKQLLYSTLERVKIFILPNNATMENVEQCQKETFEGKNNGVEFIEQDRGEYGKKLAAGAYVNEPVFDDNMNIVDRQSFLYVTRLSKYDSLCKVYGTDINLSHLIHELGHAWASEKEEFIQDDNGNYINKVGACTITARVDKENKKVENIGYSGLLMEEALNTIEEENTLCDVLGIEDVKELRMVGYVPSTYQGMMTDIMKSYVEKFGNESFDNYRYLKDNNALKQIEKSIEDTEGWSHIQTEEYTNKKRSKIAKVNDLETTDAAKRLINNLFETYDDVYFPDNSKFTPMEKLENVLTQVYNFSSVKYNFDIAKPENLEIYKEVVRSMINEGYVLKNQAKEVIKKEKVIPENTFMSQLKSNVKTDEEIASNKENVSQNGNKEQVIESKTIE